MRFEISFGVEARPRHRTITQRSLALNISAGGIRIEGRNLELHAGDDVSLLLQIPAPGDPVEGRARVIRQPIEERLASPARPPRPTPERALAQEVTAGGRARRTASAKRRGAAGSESRKSAGSISSTSITCGAPAISTTSMRA